MCIAFRPIQVPLLSCKFLASSYCHQSDLNASDPLNQTQLAFTTAGLLEECDTYLESQATSVLKIKATQAAAHSNGYNNGYGYPSPSTQKVSPSGLSSSDFMKWLCLVDTCNLPQFKAKCLDALTDTWVVSLSEDSKRWQNKRTFSASKGQLLRSLHMYFWLLKALQMQDSYASVHDFTSVQERCETAESEEQHLECHHWSASETQEYPCTNRVVICGLQCLSRQVCKLNPCIKWQICHLTAEPANKTPFAMIVTEFMMRNYHQHKKQLRQLPCIASIRNQIQFYMSWD